VKPKLQLLLDSTLKSILIFADSAFLLGVDKDYATASGTGADSTAVAISNPLGQS